MAEEESSPSKSLTHYGLDLKEAYRLTLKFYKGMKLRKRLHTKLFYFSDVLYDLIYVRYLTIIHTCAFKLNPALCVLIS